MKKKNNPEKPDRSRRDFIVRLPMAAAALTLSSSFGFPVATEEGNGKFYGKWVFIKLAGLDTSKRTSSDGIYEFTTAQIESLRAGKFESLNIKLSVSSDKNTWQAISIKIEDAPVIKQLTEIARRQ